MNEENLQQQITQLNGKLDTLLEYVNDQRLKANSMEDMAKDLQIIGKDVYDTAVDELDKRGVEIDMDEMTIIAVKLIRNMGSIKQAIETMESIFDLMKDVGPIANEVIIDITHKLQEMEEKGYPEFFKESLNIIDNIVTHFGANDVKDLANNIVPILETVKEVTQPEMMTATHNAIKAFNTIQFENVEPVSMWRLFKEMRSKEMRKSLGFMLTVMKNIAKAQDK